MNKIVKDVEFWVCVLMVLFGIGAIIGFLSLPH